MLIRAVCLAAFVAAGAWPAAAAVTNTSISATAPRDMVYDERRDIVYISDDRRVLRYYLSTGNEAAGFQLPPIFSTGTVMGIDLSPDGSTLAVTTAARSATEYSLQFVNLDTLDVAYEMIPRDTLFAMEFGTWSVAYAADSSVLVTSFNGQGSGGIRLRRLGPSPGARVDFNPLTNKAIVSASGDGKVIAYAKTSAGNALWGRYLLEGNAIAYYDSYLQPLGFPTAVGVNHDGSQVAIVTSRGTPVFSRDNALLATIGPTGGTPANVVFHPVENLAYFPIVYERRIRVVDMDDYSDVANIATPNTFSSDNNDPYSYGRTRISRDGSLLLINNLYSILAMRIYDPLSAVPLDLVTPPGQAVTFAGQGRLGIPASFSYSIPRQPAHGTLVRNGDQFTYTPNAGYIGTETVEYTVHYGKAVAKGIARIAIADTPPVAVNDVVSMTFNKAVNIRVLDNDVDPENQSLSIVAINHAGIGSVAIAGDTVRYTPPAKHYGGTVVFAYTMSDGSSTHASATVTVNLPALRQLPRAPGLAGAAPVAVKPLALPDGGWAEPQAVATRIPAVMPAAAPLPAATAPPARLRTAVLGKRWLRLRREPRE